jgi:hypothetical protein
MMTVPPELAKAEPHARASGICGTDRQWRLNITNTPHAFKGREAVVMGQFALGVRSRPVPIYRDAPLRLGGEHRIPFKQEAGGRPVTKIKLTHYPILSRWGS